MEANRRIGPEVAPISPGTACTAIFGFSEKGPYDTFCTNCERALTPYPLIKGYLRTEVGAAGGGLKLVVIDAAGPRETHMRAATIEAVLEAQEKRATHVTAAYQLTFDQEAGGYRVDESSLKSECGLPSADENVSAEPAPASGAIRTTSI